jgi:VCBS repeat-containing protein
MAAINGTDGNDTIRTATSGGSLGGLPTATDDGDTINGLSGNDLIIGGAGNDVIDGGPGNDTIRGGAGNDTLNTGATILGNEFLYGEAGNDTLIAGINPDGFFTYLFGGAGNDTIQVAVGGDQATTFVAYADRALPIVADLATGTVTVDLGGGLVETDTLINARGIRGSSGNDTLHGSDQNDILLPGLGANVIDGRGGSDSLRYMDIVGGVTIDMAAGTATKAADGSVDTFSNIEGVVGTNDADTLRGDDLDNNLRPLAGNDLVDGRGGYDTVQYSTSFSGSAASFSAVGSFPVNAGIVGNLTAGIVIDSWGDIDTLISIERITGSILGDDLTGAVLADGTRTQLRGVQGNDIYRAPAPDTNVTVEYRTDPAGVLVNLSAATEVLGGVTLAARTARDGWGFTDSFVNIQTVRGSDHGDVILGTERADVLDGEAGNDVVMGGDGDDILFGRGGNDILDGGAGNDSLRGGTGADSYRGGDGYDWINFESDGTPLQGVVASLTTGLITDPFGNAETITFNDIEMLIGTSLADDLEAKARDGYPTLLTGRGGDDTLRAGSAAAKQAAADYRDDIDANGDGFGIIADLTLANGQVIDTSGGADSLVGITSIRGSDHDDSIIANGEANWLAGEDGNDVFTYVDALHVYGDEIDGGEGIDTIQLIGPFPADAFVYDLSALAFRNVERIGLEFDADILMTAEQFAAVDAITSPGGQSSLGLTTPGVLDASGGKVTGIILFKGSVGKDTIIGTAGDEAMAGGAGDDTIDGGAGTDTAVFAGNRADYVVTASGATVNVTDVAPTLDDNEGTDRLTNVELFRFRDGTFSLTELINQAPIAVGDSFVTDEDTVLTGNVLANDTDADVGAVLTAALVAGPTSGTLALNPNGTFTYTPDANFNGSDSFSYRPSDSFDDGNVTTVTVTVNAVNDPPTATDGAFATDEDAAFSGNLLALLGAADIDGDDLDIVSVGTTGLGSFALDTETGGFTFTPAADANGAGAVAVALTDGTVTVNRVLSLSVTPINDDPVAVDDTQGTTRDTPLVVQAAALLANDSDIDGGALVITGVSNAANGTVSLVGTTITFTPTAGFEGIGSFVYTVSDGAGGTDTAIVTVGITAGNPPVNTPPVGVADAFSGNEDTVLSGNVLANDTDADAATTLSAILVSGPANAAAFTLNADGSFTYTPDANFNGADSFTYRPNDGVDDGGVTTVTLTVAAVEDSPISAPDTATTAFETAVTIDVLANDVEVDGQSLSVILWSAPFSGTATVSGDNTITFTPGVGFSGDITFSYRAFDGVGFGDTTQVSVTVGVSPNRPPVADDVAFTIAEDTLFSANLFGFTSDPEINQASIQVLGTANLSVTSFSEATGAIEVKPLADFTGTATITYQVTDAGGLTDSAVVTLTVTPVNDAPVAADDAASTAFETAVTLPFAALLANDGDVDGDTLSVITFGNAVGGSVAPGAGGIVFTPDAGFSGAASFAYTITDGTTTDSATVTVTVAGPGNTAPVAVNDMASGDEDTVISGDVLANDLDADGDTLTASVVTGPTTGTVALNADGTFTYTPAADFNGSDSFIYRVNDGTADSGVATVTLTIAPVNDAPVAQGDVFLGTEDTPLNGDPTVNDVDVDGDTLIYSVVGVVPTGLVLAPDGTFTYSPPANVNGIVGFTYRVEDGQGGVAQADVAVDLAPVNDAPQNLQLSNATIAENAALGTVVGLLSASDIDGDALTFGVVGTSPFTAVGNELRVNGAIDFETTPTLPLTLRATDTSGASVDRALTITVLDVVETNPAPGLVFSTGSQGLGDAPAGPSQGVGGLVQAGSTPDYGTLIEAVGVWNSVKNAFTSVDAWSPGLGETITVANFVDTRLDLDNAGAVGLDVTLVGAKRGEVFTAGGDDSVSIVFHSNEGTWNNTLRLGSGAGDDVIAATTVARSTLDDALLADNANPANGPLWNRNYDGRFSVLDVDVGEGDDSVTATDVRLVANGGAGSDVLVGGRRNDQLTGGDGDDVLTGGLGADRFRFDNADGSDTIMDFSAAQGDLVQLSAGGSYTLAGTIFTYGTTTVTADNGHVWTAADFLFV